MLLKISPVANLLVDGMMALDVRCLYNINDVTLTLPVGPNGPGIFISYQPTQSRHIKTHRQESKCFQAVIKVLKVKLKFIGKIKFLGHTALTVSWSLGLVCSAGWSGVGVGLRPQTQAGVVTGSGGSPFLQMAIREGHGIAGDSLQAATVGQRLTLDVLMQDTSIYDFYLHDCYAHDGTNAADASIAIVDLNGCAVKLARAVDVPVFETPVAADGPKHVYIHMYGFQFTTSQLVYFECQVRPCLSTCKRPGNCYAGNNRVRRQLPAPISGLQSLGDSPEQNYNLTTVIRIKPQQLVNVLPAAQKGAADLRSSTSLRPASKTSSELCVNVSVAIAILVIFVLVCVVSLIIAIFVCQRAHKDSDSTVDKLYTPVSTPTSSVHRAPFASARSPLSSTASSAHPHPRIRH